MSKNMAATSIVAMQDYIANNALNYNVPKSSFTANMFNQAMRNIYICIDNYYTVDENCKIHFKMNNGKSKQVKLQPIIVLPEQT